MTIKLEKHKDEIIEQIIFFKPVTTCAFKTLFCIDGVWNFCEGAGERNLLLSCFILQVGMELLLWMDTVVDLDLEGNMLGDTVVIDTANHPALFILESGFEKSFDTARINVLTYNRKIKCEVLSYRFNEWHPGKYDYAEHWSGPFLSKWVASYLNESKLGDIIYLEEIRIFDPALQKEILLPEIEIDVK